MKHVIAMLACIVPSLASATLIDWQFEQSGKICTADLTALSVGSTITLLKDAEDEDLIFVKITNPAWSAQSTGDRELEIRYLMTPYRDEGGTLRPAIKLQIAPVKIVAKSLVETIGGRPQGALGFTMSREGFDDLVRSSNSGLRIGIYLRESLLTDWIKIDRRVQSKLDVCTDLLAK